MKKLMLAAAILALGMGAAAPAFADHKEESALLAGAKLTLAEAVAKAESLHAGSRAVDADLDKAADKTVWEVTLITADKVFDVVLDAATGDIISNQEDRD